MDIRDRFSNRDWLKLSNKTHNTYIELWNIWNKRGVSHLRLSRICRNDQSSLSSPNGLTERQIENHAWVKITREHKHTCRGSRCRNSKVFSRPTWNFSSAKTKSQNSFSSFQSGTAAPCPTWAVEENQDLKRAYLRTKLIDSKVWKTEWRRLRRWWRAD